MDHVISENQDGVRAVLSGRVTYQDAAAFPGLIARLRASRKAAWEIDLSGVEFLDSCGMSLFLLAHDAAVAEKAALTLRGARGAVLEGLKRAKFDQLMTLA